MRSAGDGRKAPHQLGHRTVLPKIAFAQAGYDASDIGLALVLAEFRDAVEAFDAQPISDDMVSQGGKETEIDLGNPPAGLPLALTDKVSEMCRELPSDRTARCPRIVSVR